MKKKTLPKAMHAYKFKKGQSGNPRGLSIVSAEKRKEKKELKNLTLDIYRDIAEATLLGRIRDLKRIAKSTKSNSVKAGLAMSVLMAIKKGDFNTLIKIIETIIGKINPDSLEIAMKGHVTLGPAPDPTKLKIANDELDREY